MNLKNGNAYIQSNISNFTDRIVYLRFLKSSMLNRYLTFYKPAIQFVVFCAILCMSWLLGGHLIELFNQKITGLSADQINALKEIPAGLANQLKIINDLLLAVILLLPACLFAYLAYPEPAKYLGLTFNVKKHHWLWAITLMAIAIPFVSLLEEWSRLIPSIGSSKELDDQYNRLAESMLQGNTLRDLMSNILFMCIAPALIEELFFRACLQRILLNWMKSFPFTAILIVAIVFSAFHGQLSGFLPRVFLGLLLGLAYYYTGSIWVTILMHVFNNFLTIFFVYLYNAKIVHVDVSKLPAMNPIVGIASGIAVIGFLYLFYKDRKPYEVIEVSKEEITL